MKILLLTLGTRGDVQPFAVLGRALKLRGHEVTLSTAENFRQLVESYQLDFVPVVADYQAILNSAEGKKIMKGNPFAIRRNLEKWIYPLVQHSLTAFYTLAKTSDKVVYHVKTMADCFADQFPDKMMRAMVVPAVEPTAAFGNPALSGIPFPAFLNKFSYKLTSMGIKMMSRPIKQFRKAAGLPVDFTIPETPFIYGISPSFLQQPEDLPGDSLFTGFWLGNSAEKLEEGLLDFINCGEKPLLLTFGSMPYISKLNLQETIINITSKLNLRIIIVKGWGLDNIPALEGHPKIRVVSSAPFDKLFPLVKAVIHHGGFGTLAECVRAGVPFMVCPILHPIGDQYFWGKLAYKTGIAVKPVPLKKLTEDLFLNSVANLVTNEKLYINSAALANKIKTEDGISNAADIIERKIIQLYNAK